MGTSNVTFILAKTQKIIQNCTIALKSKRNQTMTNTVQYVNYIDSLKTMKNVVRGKTTKSLKRS